MNASWFGRGVGVWVVTIGGEDGGEDVDGDCIEMRCQTKQNRDWRYECAGVREVTLLWFLCVMNTLFNVMLGW